ncbi:MAG: hypothetical protein E7047_06850 [Lentisphaerae bacterium]|nr:hypothetical protein [Lentisphaerota bacterium]
MKLGFYSISCCAAALLLAGCQSTNQAQNSSMEAAPSVGQISSNDVDVVRAVGSNIGDRILTALQNNDYSLVKDLPIGDGKNVFTQEKFDQLYQKVQDQGGIVSFAYLGDLNMRPYHRMLWKVSFKDKPELKDGAGVDVLFEVVMVKLNDSYRAAGFAFRQ